jgi:hypothetical protein
MKLTTRYLKANATAYDQADATILQRLADAHLCQARVIVDQGQHFVYCGGYNNDPATLTPDGCGRGARERREAADGRACGEATRVTSAGLSCVGWRRGGCRGEGMTKE